VLIKSIENLVIDPSFLILLLAGGFVAATLASVTGFGGAAILLPITVAVFGVEDAVPILTIAQLIGNGSRVWFNRKEVSVKVATWFAFGCVPAAVIGGVLFAKSPTPVLIRLLGATLILMVVWRHVPKKQGLRMPLRAFAPLGAVSGFLSALVGSVGPLVAPFFLSYGLVGGAYIGTEALAAVIMHVTKTATYGSMSLLTAQNIEMGLLLGPVMILGSFAGKRIVDRIPEKVFVLLIEATLLIAGLRFLLTG
jgi:uncharacterized protein